MSPTLVGYVNGLCIVTAHILFTFGRFSFIQKLSKRSGQQVRPSLQDALCKAKNEGLFWRSRDTTNILQRLPRTETSYSAAAPYEQLPL